MCLKYLIIKVTFKFDYRFIFPTFQGLHEIPSYRLQYYISIQHDNECYDYICFNEPLNYSLFFHTFVKGIT